MTFSFFQAVPTLHSFGCCRYFSISFPSVPPPVSGYIPVNPKKYTREEKYKGLLDNDNVKHNAWQQQAVLSKFLLFVLLSD